MTLNLYSQLILGMEFIGMKWGTNALTFSVGIYSVCVCVCVYVKYIGLPSDNSTLGEPHGVGPQLQLSLPAF